jgi:hypothetical protein
VTAKRERVRHPDTCGSPARTNDEVEADGRVWPRQVRYRWHDPSPTRQERGDGLDCSRCAD